VGDPGGCRSLGRGGVGRRLRSNLSRVVLVCSAPLVLLPLSFVPAGRRLGAGWRCLPGHLARRATSEPGFFPGDPSMAPPEPERTAPPLRPGSPALAEETRLLREQTELLAREIRLLRASLVGAPDKLAGAASGDTTGAARPRATQAASGTGLPSAQTPQSSFPVAAAPVPAPAPAQSPPPVYKSTFPTAPAQPEPPRSQPASTFPVAAGAAAPAPVPAPARYPPPAQQSTFPTAPAQPATPTAPSAPAAGASQADVVGDVTYARIVSAGYENGNLANFYVDGHRVPISDGEADRRGINMVVIDPDAGRVVSGKAYDVWGDPQTENIKLAADIMALPEGHIVLIGLKDSGMEMVDGTVIAALQNVGSTVSAPLAMREGYALIGVKGSVAIAERRGAEVDIEGVLPCAVQRQLTTAPRPPSTAAPPSVPPSGPPSGPSSGPVTDVSAAPPRMSVDPQGQVSVADMEAETEGQSWEEVLFMLDKLQDKIQAKRLGRDVPA